MPSVMLFGASIDYMLIPHDFWSSNWKVMQCKKKEIKEKQRKTRERERFDGRKFCSYSLLNQIQAPIYIYI